MDRAFPILGTEVADLYCRDRELGRCLSDLTKVNPSHLQVVGPRFSGKTVFLNHLKDVEEIKKKFSTVIYWDLGHSTPDSDQSFIASLSSKISEGIRPLLAEYSDHIDQSPGDFDVLKEVVEALDDEDITILMLWDGMDKPLASASLTRNLWDQLRELSSYPSLRLVTASRRSMQELVRNEDSKTSDFWNVFDQVPVNLFTFDEGAVTGLLEAKGVSPGKGGIKELYNWTGFYPPLLLEVLNYCLHSGSSHLTNENIEEYSGNSMESLQGILAKLWDDCSKDAKDVYHQLEDGPILIKDIRADIKNELLALGFSKKTGNKLDMSCRMLLATSQSEREQQGILDRVFSDNNSYQENIAKVLELRLKQIPNTHPKIINVINHCLSDMPEDLENCMSQVKQLCNKFFELIWQLEFGGNQLAEGLIDIWHREGVRYNDSWRDGKVPRGNQAQEMRLLQLLAGSDTNVTPRSKVANKQVYQYMNILNSYGNFGQHIDEEIVTMGTAITAVTASIQLLDHLTE